MDEPPRPYPAMASYMASELEKWKYFLNTSTSAKRASTPMETSERPITQPPWMATSNPDAKFFQHWCVVLTFANTAIFIPIHPQMMDVTAPITNAIVVGTPVKN